VRTHTQSAILYLMCRVPLLLCLPALCFAADANPDATLTRLRERVVAGLGRMPNYTCVETVTRTYYSPARQHGPASCDARAVKSPLHPYAADRLRLDVAVTPAREIYSWAGASEFDARDLSEIVGGGPIGSGAFGAFLGSIFRGQAAQFTYLGETWSGGRRLMEFAYRVPKELSHYRIRTPDGWVIAAYEGRAVADPDTGDLIHLTVRAGDLPPETRSCETSLSLDYQRVAIGEADLLLPRESRQHFVLRNGIETENVATFAACREYRGQSIIRFVDSADRLSADHPAAAQSQSLALPPNAHISADLAARLDTWTASAGDIVTLRLTRPILAADRRVAVPAGAAIEARLVRVQRYLARPAHATVVVKPETIERDGIRFPFALLPTAPAPAPLARRAAFQPSDEAVPEIALPRESDFGVWRFTGDHVIVPKGYRSHWIIAPQLSSTAPSEAPRENGSSASTTPSTTPPAPRLPRESLPSPTPASPNNRYPAAPNPAAAHPRP
jgi:hypothetical protein